MEKKKLVIQMQGINPNVNINAGPVKFTRRLEKEFIRKGHKVVWTNREDFDVGLIIISNNLPLLNNKPYVQRVPNPYINSQVNFEGLTHKNGNNHIIETYKQVDAHIFQSNFTAKLVKKHFPENNKPFSVINNGTYLDSGKKRLDYLKDYEKVIFSASSWRPNKRPEDNLAVFEELKKIVDYPIAFVMVGDFNWCSVWSDDEDVYIIRRKLDDDMIKSFFRSSDYFFHMTYLDNCPNSVVEALSHSVPVLCSASGGTSELLDFATGSVVMPERFRTDIHNTYEPPPIKHNYKDIARLVANSLEKQHDFSIAHKKVDISNVADRYLSFLQEVL